MRKLALMPFTMIVLSLLSCAGSSGGAQSEPAATQDQATSHEVDTSRRRVNDHIGSGPLGSQTNPIKCDGLEGAEAYLKRLHGPNGEKTTYTDMGSAGVGPFESLIYQFDISYPTPGGSKQAQIFMDIDFAGYSEGKPATGFTLR